LSWATAYIAELKEGRTVVFRPRGNSMVPLVESGQLCTVDPIGDRILEKNDIVLCRVNGAQYLHKVTAVRPGQVQISNNRGRINGWCSLASVYGILSKVE
jgi:phage repressor protein C with HTH and peptisase S24 domain